MESDLDLRIGFGVPLDSALKGATPCPRQGLSPPFLPDDLLYILTFFLPAPADTGRITREGYAMSESERLPSRQLPPKPNIEQLKNQAKDLLRSHGSGRPESIPRLRDHLPSLSGASDAAVLAAKFSLLDAQLVVARECGFDNWHMLIEHVESSEHPPSPTDPDADPKTLRRRSMSSRAPRRRLGAACGRLWRI